MPNSCGGVQLYLCVYLYMCVYLCVFASVWQCLSVCGTSNWQGRFAVCRNHWQRFAWLLLLRAAFAFWPTANEQTNKRTTERVNKRMNKRISERMTKQTLPVCICCVWPMEERQQQQHRPHYDLTGLRALRQLRQQQPRQQQQNVTQKMRNGKKAIVKFDIGLTGSLEMANKYFEVSSFNSLKRNDI